ncbi:MULTISPECIES: HD domain-containing protein [Metallibacterium]|uniref:HD domain-containing protein n=1 Tax=Metallibacterium TaxID=1218803 RepID=UPI0026045F48|nr:MULTISPECIES: HD domain-containing protein [Metallibacterium]
MSEQTSMSPLAKAVALAERAHAGQFRKGTRIPYIAHPMTVASLVLDYGGTPEQAAAALLHDVIEDGGQRFAGEIEQQFGARVLAIVEACTDGTAESKAKAKSPAAKRADWKKRKLGYLKRLRQESDETLLVSACDKLHNARAIVSDLEHIGPAVFDRFTAEREGTLWYYGAVLRIMEERRSPVALALAQALDRMQALAGPEHPVDGRGTDTAPLGDALLRNLNQNERRALGTARCMEGIGSKSDETAVTYHERCKCTAAGSHGLSVEGAGTVDHAPSG